MASLIDYVNEFNAPMKQPETVHGSPQYKGKLFGVELEIEAPGLYDLEVHYDEDGDEVESMTPDIPDGWLREQEDSIQGVELISAAPFDFQTSCENIIRVFADIKSKGYTPIRTCRGSTHVHVNVADLTWDQMKHFVTACAWAEPALIELAGKGRKGNLFAQSYKDTPLGWAQIIDWCRKKTMSQTIDTHYMATSFHPMSCLGSVEFRMGASARNAEEAIDWLAAINVVAEAGRTLPITGATVPGFLNQLLEELPLRSRARCMAQGAVQAAEIWEALCEPLAAPQRVRSKSKMPSYDLNTMEFTPGEIQVATSGQLPAYSLDFESFMNEYKIDPYTVTTTNPNFNDLEF